jgi:hypothetical protein
MSKSESSASDPAKKPLPPSRNGDGSSAPDSDFLDHAFFAGNYKSQGAQVLASNAVATRKQVQDIAAELEPLLAGDVRDYMFALVKACHDQGSSQFANLQGSADGNSLPFTVGARIVKKHCTLRQFCMFYAPAVWNFSLDHDSPPANWLKLGYKPEVKFAAFDFFNGVTHSAALKLPTGLVRPPTVDEMEANHLIGTSAIFGSRRDELVTSAATAFQQSASARQHRPTIGWD